MRLFVGLGNPGGQYAGNRHNIGFMALNEIARRHGASSWRKRFRGLSADAVIAGVKVHLLKPETFMNESGLAVGDAMRFLKISVADVVVFHDELDLPPAKLRVKRGGGNAGHNGLRSISALCGNDYARVRLGIGHPGHKDLVHGYVLRDFQRDERPWVCDLTDASAAEAGLLVAGKDADFQNRVHLAMDGRGWTDAKLAGTHS